MSGPVTEYKKGDLVEGYQVIQHVGTGAASLIYLVQDTRTKEIWSLKHVEKHDHKDTRFLDQAIREYEVASKLDHPGIRKVQRLIKRKRLLRMTDVFLLMEFVDGMSMERRPPTTMDAAADLFMQTAKALAHMHGRGFVHADMKPNNIIVCETPDGLKAKVIDLGQSCESGTIKPRIQGTPDYIAPEQVHRRPITPRTDIYNLGATMYWVLTGEYIPTALAKPDALISRVDDNLMTRPKPAVSLNAAIPPKLNDTIMRCVEINPENRAPNMAFVADELEYVLAILRRKNAGSSAAGININQGSATGMGSPGASGAGLKSPGSSGAGIRLNQGSRPGDLNAGPNVGGVK